MSPDAELLDELVGELLWFEDQARAVLGFPPRLSGARGAVARSRAVAWLVDHLDAVLAVDGLVVEAELRPGAPMHLVEWALRWEERLRSVVGEEPPGWSPARCRCGDRNLRWDRSVGYFVCGGCGAHVSGVEERGLVAEEAG
ncbi:hypothetical protein [Nonomuraea sp. B19D2]|uniref:hypothetical protein n=1 Tax=Nonomuraea sp. B19D2 TaxID=3159561 RepID=UPI0032DBB78B